MEKVLRLMSVAAPLPEPAQLILQVHDSLMFECPKDMTERVVRTVDSVMSQGWRELGGMAIPVEYEVGEPGASWGECEHYELTK